MVKDMKVVFACAGTGGHVNPAIAIAKIILNKEPDTQILFIGAKNGLEHKLVKNAGFPIESISTGKLVRAITLKNIKAVFEAYKGIGEAKRILTKFQPDLVIGTGGYICGPVMLAANQLNIPYLLHESNAFPGIAVKLLAKKAKKVMISFEEARSRLKNRKNIVYTGTPAKFNVTAYDHLEKETCRKEFHLDTIAQKIVLVTCGSQGAKKINEVVLEMVAKYQSKDYFVILVTGDKTYEEIEKKKQMLERDHAISLEKKIRLEKFIYQMDHLYKASDLCIVRGGAMTITELSICQKPAIIIPLPTAAENHQYYNAKVLEEGGAAIILEQKELNEETLHQGIMEMLAGDHYLTMGENARKKVVNQVEETIYQCVIDVVKNR